MKLAEKLLGLLEGKNSIVFNGKNQEEVSKFLSNNKSKLNIGNDGKLQADIDGKQVTIFKDDTIAVEGGKLIIKKPSYAK